MHYHKFGYNGFVYIIAGLFLLFFCGGFLLWRLFGILCAFGLIRYGFALLNHRPLPPASQMLRAFIYHIKTRFFR